MSNFVCLVRAEDSEGFDLIFTLPGGTYVPEPGDLVESECELFPVTEAFFVPADSPELRTIKALTKICPAEAVYQHRWKKQPDA